MQVNCSTSCNQTSIFGLETLLTKKELNSGDNWVLFELTDVQEDSKLICFSNCHEQTMAPMHLTVYCEWLGPGAGLGRLGGRGGHLGVPAGWDSPCCLVVGPEPTHLRTGGPVLRKPHCHLKALLEFSGVHLARITEIQYIPSTSRPL